MDAADGLPKKKDYCWVGDAALGLVVRHLFATKYAALPEPRLKVEKIVGNKFITKNTGYPKGDDFEAWVAREFLERVVPTEAWQAFAAEVEAALVTKHPMVARHQRKLQAEASAAVGASVTVQTR